MTTFTTTHLAAATDTFSNRKLRWPGVLLMVSLVAGCATQYGRKEATSSSIDDLHETMVATRGQIEKTLASLDGLLEASPESVRPNYTQYTADTERVAELAEDVEDEARRLRNRSDAWLAGWEESHADVQDPELRSLGEERRAQALEHIQDIERSLTEAREGFAPFLSNLEDVKAVVGSDLSADGVAAVADSDVVDHANRNGKAVSEALGEVIDELAELSKTLTPVARAGR